MDDAESTTDEYFDSYEDLEIHQLMLTDKPRTLTYKNAIFNLKDKLADKTVMDVGAGTGILSIFCAQAGAKKVFAVEASNLAQLVPKVAEENNVGDKIIVIQKRVEDVILSEVEKVDVIVSEWMGFYLIHEGMLDSVIVARDKFLKPDGLMLPNVAKIYATPCALPTHNEFWDDVCGVKMKSVAENYRNTKSTKPEISLLSKEDILTDGELLVWLDLHTVSHQELDSLAGDERVIVCSKNGKYQGFAIWFDVEFPDGSTLSTGPASEPTHWKQTIIVLPNSFDVTEKEPIGFKLKFERSDFNPRRYNVSYTMLDATMCEHDIPCDCNLTACIIKKAYIQNHKVNSIEKS